MKIRLTTSFDELIKKHYGRSFKRELSNETRIEKLLAGYYGKPLSPGRRHRHHALVLSLSSDDGETLAQGLVAQPFEEYVVERSMSGEAFTEYIVYESALSAQNIVETRFRRGEDVGVSQEYQVDILQPLNETGLRGLGTAVREPGSEEVLLQHFPEKRIPAPQSLPPEEVMRRAEATDDDFTADIQAILSGQKVFDPATKKTVEKDKPVSPKAEAGFDPPVPEGKSSQAIFDRIAQSMQYANAYDLGTVELEKRFTDFDKIEEIQQKAAKKKPAVSTFGRESASAANVDNEDFLRDLDEIRGKQKHVSAPQEPSALSSFPAKAGQYAEQASVSMETLDRIAKEVFGYGSYNDYIANELSDCTFCGKSLKNLHSEVIQKLGTVEAALPTGYIAPQVDSTLRKGRSGMHGWGMAIDFDVSINPYVLNESGESELDQELLVAYDHIADFILGKAQSDLHKLKKGRAAFGGSVEVAYDALRGESDAMKKYFALMGDDTGLRNFISAEWAQNHSGQAPDFNAIKAQMKEDYEVLGGATDTGGKRSTDGKGDRVFAPSSSGGKGDPATGFLNMDKEFVVAMTNSGFAWGAIDLGRASGDIMHFDIRLQGAGAKVCNLLLKYK